MDQPRLDQVEELESMRAYDLAKVSGEKAIPFEQAVQEIERGRCCLGRKPQRGDSV